MKKFLLTISLYCVIAMMSSCKITNGNSKESGVEKINPTTFILVRHAEKEKDRDNPGLTKEGKLRAEKLSSMLRNVPIDAIYSSYYNRTLKTAAPTAEQHGLEVKIYNPGQLEETYKMMLEKYKGGTILVVGHSNTTPNFVNLLAGEEKAAAIDESEYDNLYFVSYFGKDNCDILQLRF